MGGQRLLSGCHIRGYRRNEVSFRRWFFTGLLVLGMYLVARSAT